MFPRPRDLLTRSSIPHIARGLLPKVLPSHARQLWIEVFHGCSISVAASRANEDADNAEPHGVLPQPRRSGKPLPHHAIPAAPAGIRMGGYAQAKPAVAVLE